MMSPNLRAPPWADVRGFRLPLTRCRTKTADIKVRGSVIHRSRRENRPEIRRSKGPKSADVDEGSWIYCHQGAPFQTSPRVVAKRPQDEGDWQLQLGDDWRIPWGLCPLSLHQGSRMVQGRLFFRTAMAASANVGIRSVEETHVYIAEARKELRNRCIHTYYAG